MARLLLCLLLVTATAGNILHHQKCSTAIRRPAKLARGERSVLRKLPARSNMECVISCMDSDLCVSSFYEKNSGTCTELTAPHPEEDLLSHDYQSGMLTSLAMTPNANDACANHPCPTGVDCIIECDPIEGIRPICVEDNTNCGISEEYMNIRHYHNDIANDENNAGVVHTVNYPKMRDDTLIRVNYFAALRGHKNHAGQCTRWFFKFNGVECASPQTIDWLDYNSETGDWHRVGNIDGSCGGMPAGNVLVELFIGACPNYALVDGNTGWNSNRQLTIMEILPHNLGEPKPCPGLAVFNYQYSSWLYSYGIHGHNQVVYWTHYRRMAPDTSLRIKWQANTRIYVAENVAYCGKWWIRIGGQDCSPIGDYVMHNGHNVYSYNRNNHKHRTLEAICENPNAGVGINIRVEIVTGQCYYSQTEPAHFHTGWSSPSRMHIEEVRMSKSVDAVYTPDNRVIKNPFTNVVRQHYWLLNHGGDNQRILSFNYQKKLERTALRLTASGDHRIIFGIGYGNCSRWHFSIGDTDPDSDLECSTPGRIEGISAFNYDTNYHHPMQVSGICTGVPAGLHIIGYWIGKCADVDLNSEGYTGWGSSFHLFAEEILLEEAKNCTITVPVNCD